MGGRRLVRMGMGRRGGRLIREWSGGVCYVYEI